MHGTSSLTNRTQPSFLTSNPLQTTTQQKHEQFPLLVARVHKPSPRGGPLCATAAGRGKRASALTGRAASRSASFHPSGKWSSTPTAGEAERVLAQGPRPLQCACKRACRAADLCFFVFQHALQSVCCARPLGSPLPCLGPRPARPSLVRRPTALRPRPTRMCAVFPASWRRAAQIHFCRPSPGLERPRPSARARLLSRAHLRPAPQPPSVAAHACLRCIGAAGGAGAQAVRRAQRAGRMLLGRAFAISRMTTERVLFLL